MSTAIDLAAAVERKHREIIEACPDVVLLCHPYCVDCTRYQAADVPSGGLCDVAGYSQTIRAARGISGVCAPEGKLHEARHDKG